MYYLIAPGNNVMTHESLDIFIDNILVRLETTDTFFLFKKCTVSFLNSGINYPGFLNFG